MYLVHLCESGHLPLIPTAVPAEIQEQIARTMSTVTAPIHRAMSKSLAKDKLVVTRPPAISAVSPSHESSAPSSASRAWDVTPAEKFDADQQFDMLDPQKSGVIEGDTAARYMLRFRLRPEDLAHIWLVPLALDI
jgi:hypothetical protein